jgi:hypothetical protein
MMKAVQMQFTLAAVLADHAVTMNVWPAWPGSAGGCRRWPALLARLIDGSGKLQQEPLE